MKKVYFGPKYFSLSIYIIICLCNGTILLKPSNKNALMIKDDLRKMSVIKENRIHYYNSLKVAKPRRSHNLLYKSVLLFGVSY